MQSQNEEKESASWRDFPGEECDTLFYQGNTSSQTQAVNYTGGRPTIATTGERMWGIGCRGLPPLDVIHRLHLNPEISDVNLNPFDHWTSVFYPVTTIGSLARWTANQYSGCRIERPQMVQVESVRYHAPILSEISIGQETDMNSHRLKYNNWLNREDKTDGLILWGVSRGTAATFCAFAREKYAEVRLVVLEGAIDSVPEVLKRRATRLFGSHLSGPATGIVNSGLTFFTKYRPDGPSPLKSIPEFPEGVPVVFITSRLDKEVPCANTENIAQHLADKNRNEVYLLRLEHCSHIGYMYDDRDDHDRYESFIHAIYKKYGLKHNPELADKGEASVEQSLVVPVQPENRQVFA